MGWLIAGTVAAVLVLFAWRTVGREVDLANRALQNYVAGGWRQSPFAELERDARQLFDVAEDPIDPAQFALLRIATVQRNPPGVLERRYRLSRQDRTMELLVVQRMDLVTGNVSTQPADDAEPGPVEANPLGQAIYAALWEDGTAV